MFNFSVVINKGYISYIDIVKAYVSESEVYKSHVMYVICYIVN